MPQAEVSVPPVEVSVTPIEVLVPPVEVSVTPVAVPPVWWSIKLGKRKGNNHNAI